MTGRSHTTPRHSELALPTDNDQPRRNSIRLAFAPLHDQKRGRATVIEEGS